MGRSSLQQQIGEEVERVTRTLRFGWSADSGNVGIGEKRQHGVLENSSVPLEDGEELLVRRKVCRCAKSARA